MSQIGRNRPSAMAAEHMDKAFVTVLLALSVLYISGRICLLGLKHALSARPEDQWQDALEDGAARIWYRTTSFPWVAINVVATLFCVMAFSVAVPFAWTHAAEIWSFFL